MHSAMAMAAQGVASKLVPDVSMHSHALMTKRISCSAAQLPNSHPKILQIRTTRDFRVSDRDSHCNIDWSWRREFKSISLNQAAKPTRRGKCCAVAAGGEVMEGDVVEYPLPEYVRSSGLYGARSHGLGAVSEIVADDSSSATLCHIEPLVMVEPPEPSWVVDERQEMVVVHLSEELIGSTLGGVAINANDR
uniref:Uncharacterized protein n=1 Tax=Physcomitrium patens TaxID=3218 RepID=A0A7I4C4J4_PHYPA